MQDIHRADCCCAEVCRPRYEKSLCRSAVKSTKTNIQESQVADKIVCGLGENRPNYRIDYRTSIVSEVDAEMLLANLPIAVNLQTQVAPTKAPLIALVQGPTIQIFPPNDTEIKGIQFEQEGEGGKAAAKIRVESIACELVDQNSGEVFNEVTTINIKPSDIGVAGWVGLYDFQREQHATEEVKISIYKRPRRKW